MSLLLIFFDGVGIGANDPARNPFLRANVPTLQTLLGRVPTLGDNHLGTPLARLVPTDAVMGVGGLPQSGTGQTTIFTGVNAPEAIGEHYGPYPNEALRALLAENNIFHRLRALGRRVALANAYPPIFFERLGRGKARRTAIMQAALAAGVRLRDTYDLRAGEAVSAFSLTNEAWAARGADVPIISVGEAGRILARLGAAHDFTAFEYSLTDIAGHRGEPAFSVQVIEEMDTLLGGVLEELTDKLTVLVTSDHGNLEDETARKHTRNPALTITFGRAHEELAADISSLADLTPSAVRFLS